MTRLARANLLALGVAVAALGCQGPDYTKFEIVGLDFKDDDFRPVSQVLETRCGTLDCHGSTFRPLRIFGQNGLRRPEPEGSPNVPDFDNYYSGGTVKTTHAEMLDNFESTLALEPELTRSVIEGKGDVDPNILTLIRKPRLAEKHKGGAVWDPGSAGDNCISLWLTGQGFTAQCQNDLKSR